MLEIGPKRKEAFTLIVVFVLVLSLSALAAYLLAGRTPQNEATRQSTQQVQNEAAPESGPAESRPAPQQSPDREPFFRRLFGPPRSETRIKGETWAETLGNIFLRLLLAALLGAALAFRPRKRTLVLKRNPYVAQTQILLAIVASALMIIVGDNAARAFGIFAAVSLVRFRTNIRDPKEITVLLISMALGLATGVGRGDLALILAVFALLVLWILEFREPEQVFRAMDLKVSTRNVAATQLFLKELFKRHGFASELRAINRENKDEPPLGSVVYSVDVSSTFTVDELSEQILSLDSANVNSIEWEQKKSFSYIYQ